MSGLPSSASWQDLKVTTNLLTDSSLSLLYFRRFWNLDNHLFFFRITCVKEEKSVSLKCSVMVEVSLHILPENKDVSRPVCTFLHVKRVCRLLIKIYILDNLFTGTTGIVDYTSYEDMKYAVSCSSCSYPLIGCVGENLFILHYS